MNHADGFLWCPPVAVVPAAGASRRMGRGKLLLPFGEATVAATLVAALRDGGAGEVVLVTRLRDEALSDWGNRSGCRVVVNPEPERGMLSSVRCGLEALAGSVGDSPLLVSPADLPRLAAGTVASVISALSEGARLVVPTYRGKRGHPLGITAELVPEIAELDPEVGLRQLLERHAAEVVEVAVDDPGCVRDVDTPEDYRRLSGRSLPTEPAES